MFATLANVQANRNRLLAICERCQHAAALDLDQLVAHHGPAFPVPEVRRRLRCGRCGWGQCAVQVALGDAPFSRSLSSVERVSG
jgi:hypothetical protein